VPRGLIIFLVIAAVVAAGGFWGLPWLKQSLVGDTRQVKIKVLSAEEDFDCLFKGKSVSRTIVGLEFRFPMGGAPEGTNDIMVLDDDGRTLEVNWSIPEREDLPDEAVTRWTIKEVYLPINFRQGTFKTKYRDLGYVKLPPMPFNVQR
jgi:hypothetical protein